MSAPRSAIRPAILAEVDYVRPGQTSYAIAGGLGYQGQDRIRVAGIITRMWRGGALATGTTFAPRQGRPVRTFYPAAASPPELVRRKPTAEPWRPVLARLRSAGPVMSVAESAEAACRRADPALFFGRDSEPEGDRARQGGPGPGSVLRLPRPCRLPGRRDSPPRAVGRLGWRGLRDLERRARHADDPASCGCSWPGLTDQSLNERITDDASK